LPAERVAEPRQSQKRQGPMRAPSADDLGELPKRSRVGLIAAILTVLLILALGAAAYWQRDSIAALVQQSAWSSDPVAAGRGAGACQDH